MKSRIKICVVVSLCLGGCNDANTSPEMSLSETRVQAGELAGELAGEPAGIPAGEPAGASAGEPAGIPAGEPAGASAGEPAGASAGEPAGASAGEPAGISAGEPAGISAGEPAGISAGEPAGTTPAALDCQDQMICLIGCELQDFACRQGCVLDGLRADQAPLESAQSCLDRSGCLNATCALSTCFDELTACPDTSPDTPCEDRAECLSMCGNDVPCALECTLDADDSTRATLGEWASCLLDSSCDELSCASCDLTTLCDGGATEEIDTCPDLVECIEMCGAEVSCITRCQAEASPAATTIFDTLLLCLDTNMCGSDTTCVTDNCSAELIACTRDTGSAPLPEIDTCLDLNGCLAECPDEDGACRTACVNGTPQEALDLFLALGACIEENMCGSDVTCISQNCQMELVACVSDEP